MHEPTTIRLILAIQTTGCVDLIMPQPHKGDLQYEPDVLKKRPKLAVYIANIAHKWTLIDVLHGELLADMLRSESRFTTAVYLRLRGARSAALFAVAEEALSKDLLKEFRNVMDKSRRVEESRNDVIHALWGIDNSREDIIIRIDPSTHVKWFSAEHAVESGTEHSLRMAEEARIEHRKAALVYTESDFIDIEKRIDELFTAVYQFSEKVNLQLAQQHKVGTISKS